MMTTCWEYGGVAGGLTGPEKQRFRLLLRRDSRLFNTRRTQARILGSTESRGAVMWKSVCVGAALALLLTSNLAMADEPLPETEAIRLFKSHARIERDPTTAGAPVIGIQMDRDAPAALFKHLRSFPRIEELDCARGMMTDDSVGFLRNLKKMRILKLGDTKISDKALDHIKGFENLERLELWGTSVSERGLNNLKSLKKLQHLSLDYNSISDEGLKHLAPFGELQELSLANTKITDRGLRHLKQLSNLKVLNLTKTFITDEGLAYLASLTSLEQLSVKHTTVSGPGLRHLKNIPLKFLWLSYCPLTDEGLSSLRGYKQIGWLDLSDTPISDAGLKHLKDISSLRNVILFRTKISPKGASDLEESLPKASIRAGD